MEVPDSAVLIHLIKPEQPFSHYKGAEIEACLTGSKMVMEAYVSGVEGIKRQKGFRGLNYMRL